MHLSRETAFARLPESNDTTEEHLRESPNDHKAETNLNDDDVHQEDARL